MLRLLALDWRRCWRFLWLPVAGLGSVVVVVVAGFLCRSSRFAFLADPGFAALEMILSSSCMKMDPCCPRH